jgi:hypothetical protein
MLAGKRADRINPDQARTWFGKSIEWMNKNASTAASGTARKRLGASLVLTTEYGRYYSRDTHGRSDAKDFCSRVGAGCADRWYNLHIGRLPLAGHDGQGAIEDVLLCSAHPDLNALARSIQQRSA